MYVERYSSCINVLFCIKHICMYLYMCFYTRNCINVDIYILVVKDNTHRLNFWAFGGIVKLNPSTLSGEGSFSSG